MGESLSCSIASACMLLVLIRRDCWRVVVVRTALLVVCASSLAFSIIRVIGCTLDESFLTDEEWQRVGECRAVRCCTVGTDTLVTETVLLSVSVSSDTDLGALTASQKFVEAAPPQICGHVFCCARHH